MSKKICQINLSILIIIAGLISTVTAQNLLDGPECVAFDAPRNRHLVTNVGSGRIVQIDSLGNHSYFSSFVSSMMLGCVIHENTFYYSSDIANVIGLDLETADPVFFWTAPSGFEFGTDGLAIDTSGYLYVAGRLNGYIYKVNLNTTATTTLVTTGLPPFPQELYFDAPNNRLMVGCWTAYNPIVAVDCLTGDITTIVPSTVGFADGITMDQYDNIYTASEVHGTITMYRANNGYVEDTIATSYRGPSGLEYTWATDMLVVPISDSDEMAFFSMADADGDGYADFMDNCPETYNPDQTDTSGNGVGDECSGCCGEFTSGQTGNADCTTDGKRNLADITLLIDNVYISQTPLCCEENGNVDGDLVGKVNLADITMLIDHVYISQAETAVCN